MESTRKRRKSADDPAASLLMDRGTTFVAAGRPAADMHAGG